MRVAGNRVLGHMGDVLAEKIRGEWQTKNADVLKFIEGLEKEELVRARDDEGKFIPDDPATPEVNEAWTTKIKKRVTKK
jgi:hypothetical protein